MKIGPWGLNSKTSKKILSKPEFQNSEYEVHQVGPKNSGSQNFNFKLEAQNLSYYGDGA
jgi:hypothetical protein